MTPRLLREEAARFREMAESTEREASKQRLLGMAADFEARAAAAIERDPTLADTSPARKPTADEEPTPKARGKITLDRLVRPSN
jgi:hypothetical protein